jgi:transcriptional regulator with XRE-family HTH domain
MKYDAEQIGGRLLALRNKANLSQEQVAEGCGISSKGRISLIEQGKQKELRPEQLMAFAAFFNVSTDYILFGVDTPDRYRSKAHHKLSKILDDPNTDEKLIEIIAHLIEIKIGHKAS